jgi:hypothetical protein
MELDIYHIKQITMKHLLTLTLLYFFAGQLIFTQSVDIRGANKETLIVINADDANGTLAAYSSTFPAPFNHLADRVSLIANAFTASGLDLRADDVNSDIRFYTGGRALANERMRIEKDGKVGIGTDSPTHNLHVEGSIYSKGPSSSGWIAVGIYGVQGAGSESGVFGSSDNYGVHGFSSGLYGVLGESISGTGVYYSGGLAGTGTKSAIVNTNDGPKLVYCQESPENWFEDFGSAMIKNGMVIVSVAVDFLQTVTINDDHPMKVFVTPNANLGNWWVEKRITDFILHAPNATDGAGFDYRIVAKRKGFETLRLDPIESAYTDRYLYPTVDEVPDAYKEAWCKANLKKVSANVSPGLTKK